MQVRQLDWTIFLSVDFFADAKLYLIKDTKCFTNGDGNPERWIARCVFQDASCADSLETFIQLKSDLLVEVSCQGRPDSTLSAHEYRTYVLTM